MGASPDVVHLDHGLLGHFALNAEAPHVGLRRFKVGVDDGVGVGAERNRCAERFRRAGGAERGQIAQAATARAKGDVGDAKRAARHVRQDEARNEERGDTVIGQAVVGADASFAVAEGIPGEADGGSKVVPIALPQVTGLPGEGIGSRATGDRHGIGNEDRRLASGGGGFARVEAQAVIDGQVAANLPGVLKVEVVLVVTGVEVKGAFDKLIALGDKALPGLADASQ